MESSRWIGSNQEILFFSFLKLGFYSVVLASMKFTEYSRLALYSRQFSCLSLPSSGMRDIKRKKIWVWLCDLGFEHLEVWGFLPVALLA